MPADKWICCLCDTNNVGNSECKEQCCPHAERCEDCVVTARNLMNVDIQIKRPNSTPTELNPKKSSGTSLLGIESGIVFPMRIAHKL